MEPEFWKERWAKGEIGFHRAEVNPLLQEYSPKLAPYRRVYVPLCGKSLDMVHLRESGHQVFGTEIAEDALQQFFREQDVEPAVTQTGNYRRYTSAQPTPETEADFTLLQGDAFALETADLGGPIDAIYDRASLVALDPRTRARFVESLQRVLRPGGAILLIAFEYDQSKISGPPWSVSDADVHQLFGSFASITLLQTLKSSVNPRFQEAGVTELFERAYWIEKGG
jgi:thiopurine S-methyltransferase